MTLTSARLRIIFRWIHVTVGVILLCYIYSPFSRYEAFRIFVKFVAIPVIVISGLWLWKFNLFNRWFGIKPGQG